MNLFLPLVWLGLGIALAGCEDRKSPAVAEAIASKKSSVIYGDDNRQDWYEVERGDLHALMNNTFAIIHTDRLTAAANEWEIDTRELLQDQPFCPSEPYLDQPTTSDCSGFPVAPRIVMTAGHCLDAVACADMRIVFGYRMVDADTVNALVSNDDVYSCQAVIDRDRDNDFAMIELDRPLVGHSPLTLRRSGEIENDTEIFVVGHPHGLPMKLADGAVVHESDDDTVFWANLDTYGGNSGSPVFNAANLEVEGILLAGANDFELTQENGQDCFRSNVCPNQRCDAVPDGELYLEKVLRSTAFVENLPGFPDVHAAQWFSVYVLNLHAQGIVNGYPDGLFHPERTINRAEILKIVVNSLEATGTNLYQWVSLFPPAWWQSYADKALHFENENDGNERLAFWEPFDADGMNDEITRGEMARLIYTAKKLSLRLPARTGLSDIGEHEYRKYIIGCEEAGFLSGYPDGTFRPDELVNRAEASKLVWLAFFNAAQGVATTGKNFESAAIPLGAEGPLPVNVSASTQVVRSGDQVRLTAHSPDAGRDAFYFWQANGGQFIQTNEDFSQVTWRAPEVEGPVDISIEGHATDDQAGTTGSAMTLIHVQPGEAEPSLDAGRVIVPPADSVVPNERFEIRWELGSASNNARATTALYCRENGGPWDRRYGFGERTEGHYPDTQPGTTIECKVRTRFDDAHDVWVDSTAVQWTSSGEIAAMQVTAVEVVDDERDACDDIGLRVTIRNAGPANGVWIGRGFLHPLNEDENHPDAEEARHTIHVNLAPGEVRTYDLRFSVNTPIPIDREQVEATLVVADEFRGVGVPSRFTIDVRGVDRSPPEIRRLDLFGIGEEPVGVLPGREHTVVAVARDDYKLNQFEVSWRRLGNPWQPLVLEDALGPCDTNHGGNVTFPIPAGLAPGTQLEVRLRVSDLAGNTVEQILDAVTRDVAEPQVGFITPEGGESWLRRGPDERFNCIPVRFSLVAGAEVRSIRVGLGQDNGRGIQSAQERVDLPEAGGVVETCVDAREPGDQIQVVVEIEDANREEHFFVSNPFTILENDPPAPWGRLIVEQSQQALPWPLGTSQPRTSYSGMTSSGEQIVVYRKDRRQLENNARNEYRIQRLTFDRDLRLLGSASILNPVVEERFFGDSLAMQDLKFTGIQDDFQLFANNREDDDCRTFIEPCDYRLDTRRLHEGVVTEPVTIANFPQRVGVGPAFLGLARVGADTDLILVSDSTREGSARELFRRDGDIWRRLARYEEALHPLLNYGNEAWLFRSATEGNEFVYRQYRVEPNNGELVGEREVLRIPSPLDGRTAFVAQDVHEQSVITFLYDIAARRYWMARFVDGRWQPSGAGQFPNEFRTQPVANIYPAGVITGGGTVRLKVEIDSVGEGISSWFVPLVDGAFDFSQAIHDFDFGEHTVTRDGRLIRMVSGSWNFEQRLFFQEQIADVNCWTADPCLETMWNPATGECAIQPKLCEQDGDSCNGPEVCSAATGECISDVAQGLDCDDGLACNGVEACDPELGACVEAEPILVDDGVHCTVDVCHEQDARIENHPDDELCIGNACQIGRCRPESEEADGAGCIYEPIPLMDDGLLCTTATCDPETGRIDQVVEAGWCVLSGVCIAAGTSRDGNPCEVCDPERSIGAWSSAVAGVACDDGLFCTVEDTCRDGQCSGSQRDCADGLVDPGCQRASCDEDNGRCQIANLDGVACDDDDLCNGRETCRAGRCIPGEPPELHIGNNQCTALVCDRSLGVHRSVLEGPCDIDDNACTQDVCEDGVCVAGPALDCGDLDGECVRGRCDAQADPPICVAEPVVDGQACDDAQSCTQDDRCVAGVCQGRAVECSPPGVCEAEAPDCDEGSCSYEALADGAQCPGGTCVGGSCAVDGDDCPAPLELDGRISLDLSHATFSAADMACSAARQPDVWLQFTIEPGATYTVHVRTFDDTEVTIGLTEACSDAACLDEIQVGDSQMISMRPLRAPISTMRLLRIQALCCVSPQLEVWLEAQPDACPVGSEGCACQPDNGCEGELVCLEGICTILACQPGTAGCACNGDNRCNSELICEEGLCVASEACDSGTVGCACYGNGTCNEGLLCESNMCFEPTPCPDGELGCSCYGNGTCDDDLRCADGFCQTCPDGEEGCGCYGNETCNATLECVEQRCTMPEDIPDPRQAGPGDDGCVTIPAGGSGSNTLTIILFGLLLMLRRRLWD